MIRFLHDRFDLEVSPTAMSRMLKTEGWSRKTNGRVAKQRNPDLRELYLYNSPTADRTSWSSSMSLAVTN